jgi:uncharacterized caspase-like protein
VHAIIIGIDEYPSLTREQQLQSAVSDANRIENFLDRFNYKGTKLVNEKATRTGILSALRTLTTSTEVNIGDAIFIYFAGHGTSFSKPEGWNIRADPVEAVIPSDFDPEVDTMPIPTATILLMLSALESERNVTIVSSSPFNV